MTAPPTRAPTQNVLVLAGITKRFGDLTALDDVSLRVGRGTVHALVGENGAGKTTLMRIAFGLIAPDSGTVVAGESSKVVTSPTAAIAVGLGMVHQHFTSVQAMTVAENVALGGRGRFDATRAATQVIDIGTRSGLSLDPHVRADTLSVGGQQRLEIVKALAREARTLILDEPTAVLAPTEAADLLAWLRAFANRGNAVVLITHKLDEALAVADDITVLRHGRVVFSASAVGLAPRRIAEAILGEEPVGSAAVPHWTRVEQVVASMEHVSVRDERGVVALRDASLEVRAGEIVGIAAVEGAGQHELLRLLAARARADHGAVHLPHAIGFVPEDRQRDALILDFTLTENVALKGAEQRAGLVPWRELESATRRLVHDFDVRGAGASRSVAALSGGNQQKLILARELDDSPSLLVVENPTRGLDIRATQAIRERLRAAAAAGAGVVIYSSDLDEVLELATRVFVVHAAQLRECAADRDVVGRAMLGVA